MSARGRVFLIVALVALVASGAVVAGVLATRSSVPSVKPLKGRPTLALDLGVRTDPEAQALRRASQLYNAGKVKQAGEIFGRYDSLDAEVGAALADWPAGTVERSEEHTSELQSLTNLVCRLLLEKKKKKTATSTNER